MQHARLDLYDHEGGSDALRADSPSGSARGDGFSDADGDPSDDPSTSHFLDRLSRPASDYGVDAATYLAIVTGDLAGVHLD